MLTPEEVRKIAHMARIDITDKEVTKYQKELSSILGWIDKLKEADVSGVEEMLQVTGRQNAWREGDNIEICDYNEALVQQSPNPVQDNMVTLPNIMK